MINWENIDTVLLDMDGTLLDLHFDNHFWREYVMHKYAARHQQPLDQVRSKLLARMHETRGTLDWYCLDFWSSELQLDILALKREVEHLIRLHPHAEAFLQALHGWRPMTLVTDAHPDVLQLKLKRTGIAVYFDSIISSHEFKQPKETQIFWQLLQQRMDFIPERTLLVEDSTAVLTAAKRFGISQLLAISRPDSRAAINDFVDIPSIKDFGEILPIKR
ncbi:MAG: GMP/IMP nucleotidase [Gammaproteobacteria bacterium]|nr:GMP/IMP nucleotidase [Gammaproteobacteria bacterium]